MLRNILAIVKAYTCSGTGIRQALLAAVDSCSAAQGFDVKRLYFGRHNKPDMDKEGVKLETDLDNFLKQCDVVSINLPLSDKTK